MHILRSALEQLILINKSDFFTDANYPGGIFFLPEEKKSNKNRKVEYQIKVGNFIFSRST